jgi:predicted metal-dependent HD superfamily phosphohydrolase
MELASRHGAAAYLAEGLWREIEAAYSKKGRYYHTLRHLENMLGRLEEVKHLIADWDVVLFSLFYHDIVYKALWKDNEEKSAQIAEARMRQLGLQPDMIEACRDQILATKAHGTSTSSDTNYFTDADLSILGADAAAYDEYARGVRKEYAVYPDIIYKPGRKKVLEHFLAMDRIFKTDYFFEKLEATARKNLGRESGE